MPLVLRSTSAASPTLHLPSRLFSWGQVCVRSNPKAGTASGTFGSRREPHGTQDAHLCVPALLCLSHTTCCVWSTAFGRQMWFRWGWDFFSRQALNYALPFQSNGDGSWDFVSVLVGKLKVFWKSLQNSQKHQHIWRAIGFMALNFNHVVLQKISTRVINII